MSAEVASSRSLLRLFVGVLTLIGLVFGLAAGRAFFSAKAELRHAHTAEERGDIRAAVEAYRRSLRWYAPGNPYSAEAADELLRIARSSDHPEEIRRHSAISLIGAVRAVESFHRPYPDTVASAQQVLEDVDSEWESGPTRPKSFGLWMLVALLGMIGWIGGGVMMTSRGEVKGGPLAATVAGIGFTLAALSILP